MLHCNKYQRNSAIYGGGKKVDRYIIHYPLFKSGLWSKEMWLHCVTVQFLQHHSANLHIFSDLSVPVKQLRYEKALLATAQQDIKEVLDKGFV